MDHNEQPALQDDILPNDFSLLPNEIIHDVVDSHGEERSYTYCELRKLVQIEGSWGEFARELSACTTLDNDGVNVIFYSREYDCAAGSSRENEIPLEEALNRDICSSFINGDFDLEQLTAVAPKLYNVICFCKLPESHCKALHLMGTRFSSIRLIGEDPQKPVTPEVVNFLRRQLRSNYLRKLEVSAVNFEDGAFDKELVVFVTRPWFEELCMRDAWCHALFEVIEGAHKAWEVRNVFKLKERVISAFSQSFSKETLGKIEELFETNFDSENGGESHKLKIRHPEESNASVCLTVVTVNGQCRLRMEICDL